MRSTDTRVVEAQIAPGVLIERYSYGAGPAVAIPRHVHLSYQLAISLVQSSEYEYRGARIDIPTNSLVIVHPGEPHAMRDRQPAQSRALHLLLYLDSQVVADAARDAGCPTEEPYFENESMDNGEVSALFMTLLRQSSSCLARDVRLSELITRLIAHRCRSRVRARNGTASRPEIDRVRDWLHANPAVNISLELRIEHARKLLAHGVSPSHAALESGFYDQSHLGYHFRRAVGVSPGRYVTTKQ